MDFILICLSFVVSFATQVIMIEEPNGNSSVNVKLSSSSVIPIASSTSNDDLSQSLSVSEYTDADESMSAPTEYLAEVNFIIIHEFLFKYIRKPLLSFLCVC